jgi:putative transposase
MDVQRTVTVSLPDDAALRATVAAFREVQNAVSETCLNGGEPLHAVALQRVAYGRAKGVVSSQLTITAMRLVAGAYAAAAKGRARRVRAEARRKAKYAARGWEYRPRQIPNLGVCRFTKAAAMFLVGQRGRDADFRADGTLSIWTVEGRKRLAYEIVPAHRAMFDAASGIDSVTVIERDGRLYGRVALTLTAPEPKGVLPVGVDLNETNALVAVDADGRELFVSGLSTKVRNRRTMQVRQRLQRKLAARKAEGRDTRSLRRLLKRQGRKRSARTRDFARVTAKKLVGWAPPDAVLVFEDLQVSRPEKGLTKGVALRRRLSLWQHGAIRQAVTSKAEVAGVALAFVDPAYTSRNCSRCGLRGKRRRHAFSCPHCGHAAHADVNAAFNIRDRFVQSRLDGVPSIIPEALPRGEGKPPAEAGGS